MKCEKCNAELLDNAKFCIECGTKVEKQTYCVNCGALLPQGAKFCGSCGYKIDVDFMEQSVSSENEPVSKTEKAVILRKNRELCFVSKISLNELSELVFDGQYHVIGVGYVRSSSYKTADVSRWFDRGVIVFWKRKRHDYKMVVMSMELKFCDSLGNVFYGDFEVGMYENYFHDLCLFHPAHRYLKTDYFYNEELQNKSEINKLKDYINSLDKGRLQYVKRAIFEEKVREIRDINGRLISLSVRSGSRRIADAVIDENGDVVLIAINEGSTRVKIVYEYEYLDDPYNIHSIGCDSIIVDVTVTNKVLELCKLW